MSTLALDVTGPNVGPKAATLMKLREAGFAVPAFELSPLDLLGTMQRLGTPLAVRSCATLEDGSIASFAGQFATVLDVRTLDELESAVAACHAAVHSGRVHDYCQRHGIDPSRLHMDVIVQRMVDAQLAGVAFSIDPMTGDDCVVIEACEGFGDNLLAGSQEPLNDDEPRLQRWRPKIERLARDVQRHFGSPQDIEFAIDGERLWLLQARPITRISFPSNIGQWTTADFRDGGVSASVCSPLMWSLYERAWAEALLPFLREVRLLDAGEGFEPARLFFGRPYWNVGAVKQCLAKLPGYVERRFDADLGIQPAYEGDGRVTPVTLGGILRALPIGWRIRRFFKQQEAAAQALLAEGCEGRLGRRDVRSGDPRDALRQLIEREFLRIEVTYFRTIFAASLARLDFKDAFPDADEAALTDGLPPLDHLAALRELREMARTGHRDIDGLLRRHRHHHPSGLDIVHPRWDEQRAYVEKLAATIDADGRDEPHERHAQSAAGNARREHLARIPWQRRAAFNRKLDRLRSFLYLREQMRDASSRVYYVIRRLALAIGDEHGLGDDVFFMTLEELLEDDRSGLSGRRDLYERFRNFDAPNEIAGQCTVPPPEASDARTLTGLAASRGRVRGAARHLKDATDVTRLHRGDILVCPWIDPGWTCVLDRAAGVVTERGGLLSHAAVICREFGIPTVLGVTDARRRIRDGSVIEVDGDSGRIRLLDEQET